jgi:hypothetical protein
MIKEIGCTKGFIRFRLSHYI